jgi:tight adherence protein B
MRLDIAAAPADRQHPAAQTWRPTNRLVVEARPALGLRRLTGSARPGVGLRRALRVRGFTGSARPRVVLRAALRLRRLTGSPPPRVVPRLVAGGAITKLAMVVASTGIVATALAWQGPTAALVALTYAVAAGLIVRDRQRAVRDGMAAAEARDELSRCAADLRAGVHPSGVFGAASLRGSAAAKHPVRGDAGRLPARIDAARRVADATGAPLADLLDRLEADARNTARLRTTAVAHAAGARATGWLLAALPVAGIALGYGIGTDPLHVLFHTAVGGLLTALALALQMAGLAWTHRLTAAIMGAA